MQKMMVLLSYAKISLLPTCFFTSYTVLAYFISFLTNIKTTNFKKSTFGKKKSQTWWKMAIEIDNPAIEIQIDLRNTQPQILWLATLQTLLRRHPRAILKVKRREVVSRVNRRPLKSNMPSKKTCFLILQGVPKKTKWRKNSYLSLKKNKKMKIKMKKMGIKHLIKLKKNEKWKCRKK